MKQTVIPVSVGTLFRKIPNTTTTQRCSTRRDEIYLSEVDFVEDHFVGMPNTPEPCQKCQRCNNSKGDLVIPFRSNGLLGVLQQAIELDIPRYGHGRAVFLGRFGTSLPRGWRGH